jgi:putative membrane protein
MQATAIERNRIPSWLNPLLLALTAFSVLVLVALLPPTRVDVDVTRLPALNAGLNSAATLCLVVGYVFIRRGNVLAHRRCMLFAFGLSAAFLVSYLIHHAGAGSVPYNGPESLRGLYRLVLVPHVILAAAVVPLALVTILRGLRDQRQNHRKLARITLPIWLYVSVSGVAVYWMVYRLG